MSNGGGSGNGEGDGDGIDEFETDVDEFLRKTHEFHTLFQAQSPAAEDFSKRNLDVNELCFCTSCGPGLKMLLEDSQLLLGQLSAIHVNKLGGCHCGTAKVMEYLLLAFASRYPVEWIDRVAARVRRIKTTQKQDLEELEQRIANLGSDFGFKG